ncbi:MAG: zf-HC2 domain-containing protein, partial [Microbacterium sp.]
MRASETNDREKTADADLVLRSRSGDADAFGELWARHARAGVVAARSVAPSLDPDDLVQEAFATLFQEIRRGGGPTGSFRAYLFAAIRCTAESRERADPAPAGPVDAALDESLTVTVFRHLPERWQETLWYTEVEGRKPSEIASLVGLDATEAAQLAYRARAGLRDAWIRAHAAAVPDGSDCRWTDERLGAHARGNLSARDRERADAHIASCPRCAIVAAEAQDVGSRLPLVLLPLALGIDGAAEHLTAPPEGDAGIALASMPAAVAEGTSVAADETPRPGLSGRGAQQFGHQAVPGAARATGAGAGAAAPPGGPGM